MKCNYPWALTDINHNFNFLKLLHKLFNKLIYYSSYLMYRINPLNFSFRINFVMRVLIDELSPHVAETNVQKVIPMKVINSQFKCLKKTTETSENETFNRRDSKRLALHME